MSNSSDNFFEFLNYEKRTYYHQTDSWGDGRTLDTFLEDIRDYECGLYLIGYDSGTYDFMLGTNEDNEDAVLQDFYDLLSESGRYEYDEENQDDGISLDYIDELDMTKFVSISAVSLPTETFDLIRKNVFDSDSLEYALENINSYDTLQTVGSNLSYSVKGFIDFVSDMNKRDEVTLLNITDNALTFVIDDRFYSTTLITINPAKGQFFKKHVFKHIFAYIENERG